MLQFWKREFWTKENLKKLFFQLLRFGVTGTTEFIVDYTILILLTEVFRVMYLISAGIAFAAASVPNYLLSVNWVYEVQSDKKAQLRTLAVFMAMAVIGLGLTELIMWYGTGTLGFDYRLVKVAATLIVMVYNFITRKLFLERKK